MKLSQMLLAGALALLPLAPMAVPSAHAAINDLEGNLDRVAGSQGAGLEDQDLTDTIGLLIGVLLGFLGVVFLILIIYAGLLWMTAAGNPDSVKKAKDILLNSIIGLIILLSAYAISSFVIDELSSATGTG